MMKIEATAREIRVLLEIGEDDAPSQTLLPDALRKRLEKTRRRVGKELLERYEALRAAGRRPAIAPIERGICSGCHVRLPTIAESRTRKGLAVHTCPHCRRLLYVPALLGEESPRVLGSR